MISDAKRQAVQLFSEGRAHYKNYDFVKALEKFMMALNIDPTDGPSRIFCTRCELYIKNPPPENWDGVFEMTTK